MGFIINCNKPYAMPVVIPATGPYQYPIRDINSMLQSVIEPPIGISNRCIIDVTVDNAIAIADIINCVVENLTDFLSFPVIANASTAIISIIATTAAIVMHVTAFAVTQIVIKNAFHTNLHSAIQQRKY